MSITMHQLSYFLVAVVLICSISCEHDHHHKFGEKSDVEDQEHIKQHLEDRIDVDNVTIDEKNQKWHYFTLHDINKDDAIDGLELVKAITHTHGEQDKIMEEGELENAVDEALRWYDLDKDGAVSFSEMSYVLDKVKNYQKDA